MKSKNKIFALVCLAILAGCPALFAQMSAEPSPELLRGFSRVTKAELNYLLQDLPAVHRRKLAADPILFDLQLDELRQLFAFAQQAVKDGLADRDEIAADLDWIATEIAALEYDKTIAKNPRAKSKPLGWVTAARVKAFLADADNEYGFEAFRDRKLADLRRSDPTLFDQEFTEEAEAELRVYFARLSLAAETAQARAKALGPVYHAKVDFKTRLQQAQTLARVYAEENLESEIEDEQIERYLKEHSDLDRREAKRTEGEAVLKRVLAGEDIARLAAQYSDDPGSKSKGGLYKDVKPGVFLPEFEGAVDELQPGETAKELVETDFGYHIIRLEKRSPAATDENGDPIEQPYDVRHILFATTIDDPDSLDGRPVPLKEWAKGKITSDREAKRLAELKKNNPVVIEGH